MSGSNAFRFLLPALLVLPACGGGSPAADGTGGTGTASGGASSGSGGATSGVGGAFASGGSATGGATATGGAEATGGAAPGSGGSAATGWEEIRCWRYQQTTTSICYGRIGNLWANVWHVCTAEGDTKNPMTRNQTQCSGVDDPTGWDETWCDANLLCSGRLGDWATGLYAPCEPPEGELLAQTPTEAYCGAAAEAPVGWDDVACYMLDTATPVPMCIGFRGTYYVGWGLYPTCELEANVNADPDYTEIPSDQAFCN